MMDENSGNSHNPIAGKHVFVTGATGFVGGALASRLLAGGARVRALARSTSSATFLENKKKGIEIVQGDITDARRMLELVKGTDFVMHVAGAMRGDLEHMRLINIVGTHNVVEAAAASKVRRIVHVSSVSVYGFGLKGDVNEEMGLSPSRDAYAQTKAEGERVIREVAKTHNLSYSIIRPGNMYGARSDMWTKGMFKLAKRKPTIFLGNGTGTIPVIYIDDIVDLMVVLATHPAADGEAFNATPDPTPTMRQFIGAYSKLAGHQQWLGLPLWPLRLLARTASLIAPASSALKEMPGMLEYFTSANVTYKMNKADSLLGWKTTTALESGVHETAPWLRELGLLS